VLLFVCRFIFLASASVARRSLLVNCCLVQLVGGFQSARWAWTLQDSPGCASGRNPPLEPPASSVRARLFARASRLSDRARENRLAFFGPTGSPMAAPVLHDNSLSSPEVTTTQWPAARPQLRRPLTAGRPAVIFVSGRIVAMAVEAHHRLPLSGHRTPALVTVTAVLVAAAATVANPLACRPIINTGESLAAARCRAMRLVMKSRTVAR
jgi:hypothetical protein